MTITDAQLEAWATHSPFTLVQTKEAITVLLTQRKALAEEVWRLRKVADLALRIVRAADECTALEVVGVDGTTHCVACIGFHEPDCPVVIYRAYFPQNGDDA